MSYHVPVLTQQVLDGLQVRAGGNYIDCTIGEGGHSISILEASSPGGHILGIDLDPEALQASASRLSSFHGLTILTNNNFSNLAQVSRDHGFFSVDGILFDLGLSSLQLEGERRGFSFRAEDPLDMRFDPNGEVTAWEVVNKYSQQDLIRVIRTYGEERRVRAIAMNIIENRPIDTSLALAQVVARAARRPRGRIHPATRTFQAIRMEVNRELENLEKALMQAISILKQAGRLVVISYHSLEDRIVKNIFKQESKHSESIKLINKKIISPSQEEVRANYRSRSARMRVAERI